ncbi:MAG: hypothetical protein JWP15_558 [Alphaproteobacteria bacterium]|nr:hypothetical protein [Alphaproteobacteria bacterium]
MTDGRAKPSVPGWFWAVAVVALLWEAMGCYSYLTRISMSAEAMAGLPAAQVEIWRMMPVWVKTAFAVAVWVGLSGAIGLLMRQRWARETFAVSLLAALVQFGWTFLATPAQKTLGIGSFGLPAAIILVGAASVWFAGYGIKRGWLR